MDMSKEMGEANKMYDDPSIIRPFHDCQIEDNIVTPTMIFIPEAKTL